MSLEEGRTEDEARRFLAAQPEGAVTNGTIMRAIQHGYAVRVEDEMREKLVAVLTLHPAFGITISRGWLEVQPVLDGSGWRVIELCSGDPVSLGEFRTPHAAVDVLLNRRRELQIDAAGASVVAP
jgi:hypothetical protein